MNQPLSYQATELSPTEVALVIDLMREFRPVFQAVSSFGAFGDACDAFIRRCPYDQPISRNDEAVSDSTAAIQKLRSLKYPNEYFDWVQQFGTTHFWIGIQIQPLTTVLSELAYWDLLTENGLCYFASSASGDAYVFDTSSPHTRILFADHSSTVGTIASISTIYEEFFEYEYDEDSETYVDTAGDVVPGIFSDSGSYVVAEPLVRRYLEQELVVIEAESLLDFLKLKTLAEFDQFEFLLNLQ
jgi:hypothetical protein